MLKLHAQRPHTPRLLLTWQGWLRGLLLALLLLFVQQGALLHELSHNAPQDQTHRQDQQSPADGCDTCLAYAHLGATPTPVLFVPPLLAGLAYAYSTRAQAAPRSAARHFLHNRGPPSAL